MNTIRSSRPRNPISLTRAMVVLTMLLTSLLIPVAPGVAMSPSGYETGGSGSGSSNEATAFRLFSDVFSGKSAAACAELVSENAVIHTPNRTYTGHVGMLNFVDEFRASFANASFEVTDLMADGDTVVASWVMTGTQNGAFQSIAATGAPVTLNGITILRFELDMIVEEWVVYDRLHLMQQIGADDGVQNGPTRACPPCLEP